MFHLGTENMKPAVISYHAHDPENSFNRGVEADDMAGYTHAYARRPTACSTCPAAHRSCGEAVSG
jgi:hypothetical protein